MNQDITQEQTLGILEVISRGSSITCRKCNSPIVQDDTELAVFLCTNVECDRTFYINDEGERVENL